MRKIGRALLTLAVFFAGSLLYSPALLMAQETGAEDAPVDLVQIESEDGTAHYVAVPKEGVVLEPEPEGAIPPELPPVQPEITREATTGLGDAPADSSAQGMGISTGIILGVTGGVALLGAAIFITCQFSRRNS